MVKKKDFVWAKQTMAKDAAKVDCADYDPYKDFRRDISGYYVLIRVDPHAKKIEAAVCNKDHEIVGVFRGAKSQDVYEGIFQYEKKNALSWFTSKGHMAYLGKELKKAEWSLALGADVYVQE